MSSKLRDEEVWLRFAERMAGQKVNGRHHSGYVHYISVTRDELSDICEKADLFLEEFKSRFRCPAEVVKQVAEEDYEDDE